MIVNRIHIAALKILFYNYESLKSNSFISPAQHRTLQSVVPTLHTIDMHEMDSSTTVNHFYI